MDIEKMKVPYTKVDNADPGKIITMYRFTYKTPLGRDKEFFITVDDYKKMGRGLTYDTRIFNNIKFDVKHNDGNDKIQVNNINIQVNPIELFMPINES